MNIISSMHDMMHLRRMHALLNIDLKKKKKQIKLIPISKSGSITDYLQIKCKGTDLILSYTAM